MAVLDTDVELRYSGGAGNVSPAASLGGALATGAGATIDDNVANDLFADTTTAEAAAGSVKYRGIYAMVKATAVGVLTDARLYISLDSPSASDVIDVALATEAVSTPMGTIVDENTVPVGPVFSHPTTYAGGLQYNGSTGLAAGQYRGVWVRRTISAAAAPGTITNELATEGSTV